MQCKTSLEHEVLMSHVAPEAPSPLLTTPESERTPPHTARATSRPNPRSVAIAAAHSNKTDADRKLWVHLHNFRENDFAWLPSCAMQSQSTLLLHKRFKHKIQSAVSCSNM